MTHAQQRSRPKAKPRKTSVTSSTEQQRRPASRSSRFTPLPRGASLLICSSTSTPIRTPSRWHSNQSMFEHKSVQPKPSFANVAPDCFTSSTILLNTFPLRSARLLRSRSRTDRPRRGQAMATDDTRAEQPAMLTVRNGRRLATSALRNAFGIAHFWADRPGIGNSLHGPTPEPHRAFERIEVQLSKCDAGVARLNHIESLPRIRSEPAALLASGSGGECGEIVTKMIPRDSSRVFSRSGGRPRTPRGEGGLNLWHLRGHLPHGAHPKILGIICLKNFRTSRMGEGGLNLWHLRGRQPHGSHTQIFFCAKTF